MKITYFLGINTALKPVILTLHASFNNPRNLLGMTLKCGGVFLDVEQIFLKAWEHGRIYHLCYNEISVELLETLPDLLIARKESRKSYSWKTIETSVSEG